MEMQPIIRGVQSVGRVQIKYCYLGKNTGDDKTSKPYALPIPSSFTFKNGNSELTGDAKRIITMPAAGIPVAGFRLDAEFVRANPQIASSFTIPLLGGGGVSLTNNNRTGQLTLACTKVAVPNLDVSANGNDAVRLAAGENSVAGVRAVTGQSDEYYDMVTLAQIQQAQDGGDSYGANISLGMEFAGVSTVLTFEMCTVASVDPIGIAGNDAVNYQVVFNYLNWTSEVSKSA